MHGCVRRTFCIGLASLCVSLDARAQSASDASSRVVLTGRDLALIGGATTMDALLSRADVRIARLFSDSAFHTRHPGFTVAAKRASLATETVLMIGGGTVYGIARLRHDDGTADVALHATEAVASTAMFIQVVRGILGRARPYVVDDSGQRRDADPYDFELFHGFTSYDFRSFPSMHAMASIAVASALTAEMRARGTSNRALISPVLYVGAVMPALARMYLDEHWTSDIALGAFLGAFAGQKVVSYSHANPTNRVDHFFLRRRVSVGVTSSQRGLSFFATPF
jgi:membrane-associated phospholipid phosphatase